MGTKIDGCCVCSVSSHCLSSTTWQHTPLSTRRSTVDSPLRREDSDRVVEQRKDPAGPPCALQRRRQELHRVVPDNPRASEALGPVEQDPLVDRRLLEGKAKAETQNRGLAAALELGDTELGDVTADKGFSQADIKALNNAIASEPADLIHTHTHTHKHEVLPRLDVTTWTKIILNHLSRVTHTSSPHCAER